MSTGEQTSYDELAQIVDNLPVLIRENRRRQGLSMRAAARLLNVSFSTVLRMENGEDYNSRVLPDVLRWLGAPAGTPDQPKPGVS